MMLLVVYLTAALTVALAQQRSPMENDFTEDGEKLWGGDMVLTPEQEAAWFGGGPSSVDSRKAIANLRRRWPSARVPYRFDSSSPPEDREAIRRGLQHWTQHTCLTFPEVVHGRPRYPHLFFKKGTGCWSYVGRVRRRGQDVSIGQGCTSLNTVVHEVGHAIGFVHEQSRRDRDQFVRIHYENIRPGAARNFNIERNTNNYGVPYDLTSVMHYGPTAFSQNGRDTITAVDETKTFMLGLTDGLSFADKKLANIIYHCSARCPFPRPVCQNSGFVDKNCRCICPTGFNGNLCENRE